MNEENNKLIIKCDVEENDFLKIEYENDPDDGIFVSFLIQEGSLQQGRVSILIAKEEDAIKIRDFLNEKLPQF